MGTLTDRRIAVTRDEGPDGPLATLLRDAGAVPVHRPTVEIAPVHTPEQLRRRLPDPADLRWIVITSSRTVDLLADSGWLDVRPRGPAVAAVGPRTAEALAARGWTPDLVPDEAGAEPLVRALRTRDPAPGGTAFYPASARADDRVSDALEAAGFRVVRLDLYAPRPVPRPTAAWAESLPAGDAPLDALTFTSPSAVEGLVATLDPGPVRTGLAGLPAGVQGPTTAAAAARAGWTRLVEADPRTFAGLVAALERHFSGTALGAPPPPTRTPG
jgi:uroporphyrinogen-III synthase